MGASPMEHRMAAKKPQRSQTLLVRLPAVVMAVVAAGDLLTGPGVGFLPLASLGPAFAGLAGGWRRTAWYGLAALLLCVGLGLYDGLFQERRGFMAMVSVVGVTGASVVAAVMRGRREAELANVRSIAEVAQRVLLRPVPLSAGPLQAAVSYTSAVAEARIGGDLYEVVSSPHGVRMIVGDVQGKGLAAVETAAVVLGAFREAAHDEPDLVGLGERLERSVSRVLEGRSSSPRSSPRSVSGTRPSSSTTATRPRWSYGRTAPPTSPSRRPTRRPSASGCSRAAAPSRSPWASRRASNCCSTPTE